MLVYHRVTLPPKSIDFHSTHLYTPELKEALWEESVRIVLPKKKHDIPNQGSKSGLLDTE